MNPWFAKTVILAAIVALVAIRAPHGQRSRSVPVSRTARGPLETSLLAVAWIAFFVPLVWIAAPAFSIAEYPLAPIPLIGGAVCIVAALWLFHRSHADLGTNWSITLEVRQSHQLITHGVYRWVRHPMYLALIVYAAGLAMVIPNWIAGPSYLVAMLLLVVLRLGPEERLMRETFGERYERYASHTRRLIPGVW